MSNDRNSPTGSADHSEAEYGPNYYQNYWGGGGPYERNEQWLKFFNSVAAGIIRDLSPLTVLDAGCAMGFLVEGLVSRGVDAEGIDVSEYAISQVDETIRDRCSVASLTEPLDRRYDLITCIEVIEHIPADEVRTAIGHLCAASDRILISSTPQDFGEPTHLNVQPPEHWSALFLEQGFVRDLDLDLSYISPWATLYRAGDHSAQDVTRRYDRAWYRQKQEIRELRQAILEANNRISEFSLSDEDRKQIARLKNENLEIRDLMVQSELELGKLRGRLAETEDAAQRLTNVQTRIESRIPGPLLGFLLRIARGLNR